VQHERKLLELEQEKSERLLLNVLPQTIAVRLKQGERTIAERYIPEVTRDHNEMKTLKQIGAS